MLFESLADQRSYFVLTLVDTILPFPVTFRPTIKDMVLGLNHRPVSIFVLTAYTHSTHTSLINPRAYNYLM